MPLGHEEAEAVGKIEIAADRFERFGIDRGHVDRVANFALGEVVDEQLNRFDRDLRLGFFGARAQVRRAEYIGHAEEWAIGAGLFDEHIERYTSDLAAFETFDERLFVVDAAAG